jgi:intracellular septation protein
VGIWVMALPGGWFTIIGPLTIHTLIVYVSGIPLAEKGMQDNPDFVRYQATTSSLVPIPHIMTRLASPHTIGAILIEFGPLLLFFVTFEFFDFFTSVMILIGAVTVAVYGSLRLYRKLSLFPIISSGSVILFGIITVITQEPFWIIFKDTLYFGIFGILILVPLVFNRLVLKHLFEQVFAITDIGWKWVSWNWAIFMILIAISNEVVRVRISAEAWVHYKMMVLIIVVVFSGIQMIIASRTRLPEASVLGLRR